MENRPGNSKGVKIPKKSRSLDLKSLYESNISKDKAKKDQGKPVKRKSRSPSSANEENRKKRRKKQGSRITSEPVNTNSKKSVDAVTNVGTDSGLYGVESIDNGASGKSNTGRIENGSCFSLDGNTIQVPKRKRGFVRRRKMEDSQELKLPEHPGSILDCRPQPSKSEECVRDYCGNGNQVGCSQDIKEHAISSVTPDKHPELEAIPSQNDGLSIIKPRRKHRKSKNAEVARTEFVQLAESGINNSLKAYIDMQEDDEENLEENAARMLSSRFDPSCMDTCSKGKSSAQSSKCKTRVNPRRNSRYRSRSPAISDTISLDAADRTLRPRQQNKERGVLRKRRHFYEIAAEELDALWILNKRIKVFWPLDEKWYFGLVNEYDEVRKLHHIKYDDRDEEWINLQNERFKLLLLRGDVTGKAGQKRVVSMENHLHYRKGKTRGRKEDRKRNLSLADDSTVMDSEPIISWLARSLSSTSHAVKKQKSSLKLLHSLPSTCYDDSIDLQVNSLKRVQEKLHCDPVSVDKSVCSTENSPTNQRTLPIVYVRRNSRKIGESFPRETEDDSVYTSVLKSEHYNSTAAGGASGYDVSCEKSQHRWSLWSSDDSSFLDQITNALTGSGLCKLKLCISFSSILNYSLTAKNFQLLHALFFLQYGVLMIMWPKVHLEMLFVDSVVGLRFLLFEGSLKDALAFTFMVLAILTPSSVEEKNVNLQSPATSTSFKFVSVQGSRKQLVFGFDNFIALENSKWTYLDMKLMNHCLLTKQLPLSECTYDNMKVFHGGSRPIEPCQYGVMTKVSKKKHKSELTQGKSIVSPGFFLHRQCDAKTEPLQNGFVNGPKKPRTQVSYSMPSGGFDSKNRVSLQKTVHHKRIRRPTEKKSADSSVVSQRNFELLCCDANVLITDGDRGWRECGAKVLLVLADQNEWKLAVRISGITRYSYKAHQFLQAGSTNRYTHAMMWKGGKDWSLEFPDRSQWSVFKEMYEECHNRNIRAASIKSIPIPGVRLVDGNDDSGTEVTFVRGTSKYFRQLETDIEMALNPSRILYDMDSEDEKWIHANRSSLDVENHIFQELSDELFERTIDRLEKAAYAQNRDQFTAEEIQEFMDSVGSSIEVIQAIHGYWRQKREKKGTPLIRHFQPPQWEQYQQQIREWEVTVNNNKVKNGVAQGCQKGTTSEKPTIFAFCMKPRGLEVPNKGSKQRSHKKMSIAVHNSCALGEHDGLHAAYGRRSNGFGDERGGGQYYESMEEVSPLSQSSSRLFYSPSSRHFSQDSSIDRYYYPRTQRNNRRFGTLDASSPHNSSTRMCYATTSIYNSPRASTSWRNGSAGGNYSPDWRSSQRRRSRLHDFEDPNFGNGEMDEDCILRDASGAAQHARKLAKVKKERAHRLFFRANMAIHKAVAALMTAEAMKPSSCSPFSSSSPSSQLSSSSSFSSSSEDVSGSDQ